MHFIVIFMKFDIKILKNAKKSKWKKKKKSIIWWKLCTSSWKVSGRQPLPPPSERGGRGGWGSVLWMLYLSCFCVSCPAQSGPIELYISTHPEGFGALCISLALSCSAAAGVGGEAHFKRYKVLKKQKEMGNGYLSGLKESCSTQAKITIACFCNCLDPSSDRPNSRGPPSILN